MASAEVAEVQDVVCTAKRELVNRTEVLSAELGRMTLIAVALSTLSSGRGPT